METSRILIDAGLSEEQALLYESLLEKGPQKASALATWTGIKRSTVYKTLNELESLGLVNQKGGKGTVAVFSPNHPSLLMQSFDRKEKELFMAREILHSALGILASKFNLQSGKPNVQFYEGVEAITQITGDLPVTDKEVRQFMDMRLSMEKLPEDTVKHLKKRVAAGITKRMIIADNPYNRDYAKKGTDMTEFKIARGVPAFPTAILAYDSKVSMLTLTPEKTVGLIIEDKEISETIKTIFDGYWKNVAETITSDSASV